MMKVPGVSCTQFIGTLATEKWGSCLSVAMKTVEKPVFVPTLRLESLCVTFRMICYNHPDGRTCVT